jgi:NitT/TauT family transport system ATP-binding protein
VTRVDTFSLLELRKATKRFPTAEGGAVTVIDDVSLEVGAGEILALLGRSGCGKSTLLRMLCGLSPPSSGEVRYKGRTVGSPQAGISMVFQSFALFPWLTVLQNVELGLEAQGIGREQRRRRALQAIDMIGLDGFESAFPKELSGGMRQRVGFARALVVNPDVLLMDEAFSALDVPTAETLRNDLLDLWLERQIPTRAIVMVSHNIGEALLLADRVVILDSNPGRVKEDLRVDIKHPRDRDSRPFKQLMERVYAVMTRAGVTAQVARATGTGYRLPQAHVGQMLGVLEELSLAERGGSVELAQLATTTQMTVDDLFPILDALELLDFARVSGQLVELTRHGRSLVEADILRRKVIFGEHLLRKVPLADHVRRVLDERARQRAPKGRFLRDLEDFLTEEEAERVLAVITDWGRYAEIFAFDAGAAAFSLENPVADATPR